MSQHLRVTPVASATPGLAPRADEIGVGELAINTADGRLFVKNSAGSVVTLCTADAQGTDFGRFTGGAPFAVTLDASCGDDGVALQWSVTEPECSSQAAATVALETYDNTGVWGRSGEYAISDAPSLATSSVTAVRGLLLDATGNVLAQSGVVGIPTCPPVITYNCSGSTCYEVTGRFGAYTTLAACQQACVQTYACVSGSCQSVAGASGAYATMAECQASCTSSSYNCVAGSCREVPGSGGQYATLAACQQANCGSQTRRYYCDRHACRQVGEFNAIDGQYVTSAACENAGALPRTVTIATGQLVPIVLPCRTLAVRVTATGSVSLAGNEVGPDGYTAPQGAGFGTCGVLYPKYAALVGRFTSDDAWQAFGGFTAIGVPQNLYSDSQGYHTLWLRIDWYCDALPGEFTVVIEEGTIQVNPAP